ncbi:MAG: DUF4124 domain-containing protein [Gammaproteobacteria bacterium]|nr:DUF4124 domain-containing protein [Gammaproteobacteria bacterium]
MLVNSQALVYAFTMTKFLTIFICLLFSVSIMAETVYKKTNPDGSVEFTDTGSKDSEEIKIRKPTTYTPPRLPKLNLPVKKIKPSFNYNLTVIKPAEDSVIVNQSNVTVAISLQPPLISGHQVQYELAGESKLSTASSVIFMNVPRGSHSIIITVIDNKGVVVSPIVSRNFHMKRFFKKPTVKPKVP